MWALEIIGYLALGLVVVLGAVVALPIVIAKAAGHDQATCQCWDCQNRRARALNKAREKEERKKNRPQSHISPQGVAFVPESGAPATLPSTKDFWSTEELRTGYHVYVKGTTYKVTSVRAQYDGKGGYVGTRVELQNVLTEAYTFLIIPWTRKDVKMWRKGSPMDML